MIRRGGMMPVTDITIDEGRGGNLEMKRYEKDADALPAIYGRQGREIDKAVELAEKSKADDVSWRDFLPVHALKG